MANPNEAMTQVGLRFVRAALRDTDGAIAVPAGQPTATGYAGLKLARANALTATVPEPNRVQATGDDRVYHTFQLPPDETVSGELRCTATDQAVIALLTGVNVFGTSPIRMVGVGTDKQGEEPAVILWGCSQAVDSDPSGDMSAGWLTYIFLNALCTPRPGGKERASISEVTYAMVGNDSAKSFLGQAFTTATHGFTNAPLLLVATDGKFGMCAWVQGGAATTVFNLPAGEFPLTAGTTPEVWVNGVKQTSGVTVNGTLGTVTFETAPAQGAKIVALYEYD